MPESTALPCPREASVPLSPLQCGASSPAPLSHHDMTCPTLTTAAVGMRLATYKLPHTGLKVTLNRVTETWGHPGPPCCGPSPIQYSTIPNPTPQPPSVLLCSPDRAETLHLRGTINPCPITLAAFPQPRMQPWGSGSPQTLQRAQGQIWAPAAELPPPKQTQIIASHHPSHSSGD